MCSMQLNYSKEAIDSEFDLFEITAEWDWFLPVCPLFHLFVCKYILYVQQIASVCVYLYIVGDRLKPRNSIFPGFRIFTLLSA